MAKPTSRIGKPEDATPRWVDKTFTLSGDIVCHLRGNANVPEQAILRIFEDGEEGLERTKLISLDVLMLLTAEMQDFIARMQSRGNH